MTPIYFGGKVLLIELPEPHQTLHIFYNTLLYKLLAVLTNYFKVNVWAAYYFVNMLDILLEKIVYWQVK